MNFDRVALLYQNTSSNVSVYTGQLKPSGTPVAIKELTFPNQPQAQAALTECANMQRLSHPHICRIYDYSLEPQPGGTYKLILLCELMSNDLAQEIDRRKATHEYWSEADLLQMLADLVGALAYAQEQGVSHRDIKPQNIFVANRTVKVGDFGSSVYAPQGSMQHTIKGSPLFLSPELKVMYIAAITTGTYNGYYDTYRADVYSLGVSLMYLAYMSPPLQLGTLANLDQTTEALVAGLGVYPTLSGWLRIMLRANRPDFLELKRMVDRREPLSFSDPGPRPPAQDYSRQYAPQFQQMTKMCSGCGDPYWQNAGHNTYCSVDCMLRHTRMSTCTGCGQIITDIHWYSTLAVQFQPWLPYAWNMCGMQCLMKVIASPSPQYYAQQPLAQAYSPRSQTMPQQSLMPSMKICRACKTSVSQFVQNEKGSVYCTACHNFYNSFQKCDICSIRDKYCVKIGGRTHCKACKGRSAMNQQVSLRRQQSNGRSKSGKKSK